MGPTATLRLLLCAALASACIGDIRPAGDDPSADGGPPDSAQNQPPVAAFTAMPLAGPAPLVVDLDASASADPDGTIAGYGWQLGDGATDVGVVASHSFAAPGCFSIQLTVTDDDGATDTIEQIVVVTEGIPAGDPQVTFTDLPAPMQVVPRDVATNLGTVAVHGTVASPGYDSVVIEVNREAVLAHTVRAALCSTAVPDPFAAQVAIPAELASYDLDIYLAAGDARVLVGEVDDVVAGDLLIIQGQSNAVANMYSGDANVDQGRFLRSFGTQSEDPTASATDSDWHLADGNSYAGPGSVGQWGLRMARLLSDAHGVPIAILNGARGGMPISYFQRNDADPTDPATNYGRLLSRARRSGVAAGVRAILFYQGESDGADAAGHRTGLLAVYQDWLEDFPALERVFVTQVRNGCGSPTPALREVQRVLADEYPGIGVMSTTGLDGHDGCHFPYDDGYRDLGERYAALLTRDLYDGADLPDLEPPNPSRAFFSTGDGSQITLVMRREADTLTWDVGAEQQFVLEGAAVTVQSGQVVDNTLVLTLSGDGRGATGLSYVGHPGAGPWVTNANHIGLLAFFDLPIDAS